MCYILFYVFGANTDTDTYIFDKLERNKKVVLGNQDFVLLEIIHYYRSISNFCPFLTTEKIGKYITELYLKSKNFKKNFDVRNKMKYWKTSESHFVNLFVDLLVIH